MISVKNLSKTFGHKTAVSDLSFEVESGEILGFLGPNGAGKTTTMRVLTGFFPPTTGTAVINGVDVCQDPLGVRQIVGYLPEHVPLYHDMTCREFLSFAAAAKKVPKARQKSAVDNTLERCNLGPVADQLIATISRGYRQRVGLGQAIVSSPKVLILDEPTVGLDPSQVRDIRALLRDLGKDSTVILSSHILSEVQQMCHRVVIIANGKMQAIDTPENLTRALQGENRLSVWVTGTDPETVQAHLSTLEFVKRVEGSDQGRFIVITDSAAPENVAPQVAQAIVSKGWSLCELKPEKANLEDIYIELVDAEKGASHVNDLAS